MVARRAAPTTLSEKQREVKEKQAKERDATRQFVGSGMVRTAERTHNIDCFWTWLWSVGCKEVSRGLNIFIANLDAHAANGVGVEPVHLNEMFILNERRNAHRFQARAEQMRLFRFAECRDSCHLVRASPNETEISHG